MEPSGSITPRRIAGLRAAPAGTPIALPSPAVNLFIDTVCSSGLYRAAPCPTWLDARVPTRMLLAGAPNAPHVRPDQRLRLFHIEARRFLGIGALAQTGFEDLDTIIVVATDDQTFADPSVLRALWEVTGGLRRHATRRGRAVAAPATEGNPC